MTARLAMLILAAGILVGGFVFAWALENEDKTQVYSLKLDLMRVCAYAEAATDSLIIYEEIHKDELGEDFPYAKDAWEGMKEVCN